MNYNSKTKAGFGNCFIFVLMCMTTFGLVMLKNSYNTMLLSKFEYHICNEDVNSFKLEKFELEPSEPVKGKNITIKVVGDLMDDIIDGSKIMINVKLNSIRLLRKTIDLCSELEKNPKIGLNCPITTGKKEYISKFEIPNEVPNGKYIIDILMTNADNSKVFCSVVSVIFN